MVLTVFPELRDKLVGGLVEQSGDVVIQRVHVLHQPLIGFVVYLEGYRVWVTSISNKPPPSDAGA